MPSYEETLINKPTLKKAVIKWDRRMSENISGRVPDDVQNRVSELDGPRIMRGMLIGLAISIVFWIALYLLLF